MKRPVIILLVAAVATGSVVAGLDLLHNDPPPVELPEAYAIAVKALGTNAADYHCIGANPVWSQTYLTNHLTGEWSFDFMTTNHEFKNVWVFFDDKTANTTHPAGF